MHRGLLLVWPLLKFLFMLNGFVYFSSGAKSGCRSGGSLLLLTLREKLLVPFWEVLHVFLGQSLCLTACPPCSVTLLTSPLSFIALFRNGRNRDALECLPLSKANAAVCCSQVSP